MPSLSELGQQSSHFLVYTPCHVEHQGAIGVTQTTVPPTHRARPAYIARSQCHTETRRPAGHVFDDVHEWVLAVSTSGEIQGPSIEENSRDHRACYRGSRRGCMRPLPSETLLIWDEGIACVTETIGSLSFLISLMLLLARKSQTISHTA